MEFGVDMGDPKGDRTVEHSWPVSTSLKNKCDFCPSTTNVDEVNGIPVCEKCLKLARSIERI
jgi:hypothetical protein